jgi:hypothetical protein
VDFSRTSGDRIILNASRFEATQLGADTVVEWADGDKLTLVGVKLQTLVGGWIEYRAGDSAGSAVLAEANATFAQPSMTPDPGPAASTINLAVSNLLWDGWF